MEAPSGTDLNGSGLAVAAPAAHQRISLLLGALLLEGRLGFALFGLLTIALIVQVFWTLADLDRYGNDWIAALGTTVLFAIMTYLFATTRTKDF